MSKKQSGGGISLTRYILCVNVSRINVPRVLVVALYRTGSIMLTRIGRIIYIIQNAGAFVLVFYRALTARLSEHTEYQHYTY